MATEKITGNTEVVTEFIQKLDPAIAEAVEAARQIIVSTNKEIGEQIKWNSPAFFFTGEMKPFNPKEYKRDIVVFNISKGRILLIFPGGAKVNDTSGLMEGNYKDGRRLIIIKDLEDLKSKEKALREVIRQWLKLVDK